MIRRNGHEKPADSIKSLSGYKIHLCERAYDGKRVNANKCVCCPSQCKYGKNMLRDMAAMGMMPVIPAKTSVSILPGMLADRSNYNLGMKMVLRWHLRGK